MTPASARSRTSWACRRRCTAGCARPRSTCWWRWPPGSAHFRHLPTSTLTVTSAVTDERYQQRLGVSDPPAAGGWSFTIARHYVDRAQAAAFQAMLDRLQALDLIAWERFPSEIEITVASDASHALVHGP